MRRESEKLHGGINVCVARADSARHSLAEGRGCTFCIYIFMQLFLACALSCTVWLLILTRTSDPTGAHLHVCSLGLADAHVMGKQPNRKS